MSTPIATPGPAFFLGWQHSTNEVIDRPPREYVMRLTAEAATRARWRASTLLRTWRGHELYLASFVDPETAIVFALPDADESSARRKAWETQSAEEWTFSDARAMARWLQLYAKYVDEKTPRSKLGPRLPDIWREYLDGRRDDVAPTALGLPRNPDEAFAGAGWADWENWHWEPRASGARPGTAA
jgi:hypothetical protein